MRRILAVFLLIIAVSAANAHYNMLLPDKAWAQKGEKVTFTYQFGHPFEHELFEAPKPVAIVVITPKGKEEVLAIDKMLSPIKKDGADGKQVTAWQFTFTPPERGDYTFALKTPKIKHDEGKFIEDVVKVVLHVQTQNGWSGRWVFKNHIDIEPFTRPYGILPGMVFRGRALPTAEIEIEKYNPKPVKNLPPDELITFKAKADDNGFFVTTLPEAGWWGVTAITTAPSNVGQRATFWVHVDEKK
jgi:cobalt/nickel transport protein